MSKERSEEKRGAFKPISYLFFYLILLLFIIALLLYSYSLVTLIFAEVSTTALFSLLLPALAFAYLAHKGKSFKEALYDLGIIQGLGVFRILGIALLLFLLVFVLELIITFLNTAYNLNVETNACSVITGMPLWFILFVILVGPLNEELFFRGFLVKRIGIIPSAFIFAILHAGYGSTFGIDMIAAFIFGLLAGYVFKKTNSIYPSFAAHVLVNLIAALGCI